MAPEQIQELLQLVAYTAERRFAADAIGYQLALAEIEKRLKAIPAPTDTKPDAPQ